MPPDDNLFPETPTETPTPEGTTGNGADPAGEAPMTMAAAAELVTQAQAPLLEKIDQLTRATAAAVDQRGNPDPGPASGGEPPADFLTQFSESPEGAIDGRISAQLQTVAPLVSGLINSTVSNFVVRESNEVDAEFGKGAWDKYFDKPLNTIMDNYRQSNAVALADHNTIRREVDGLKGRMFNDLVTYRDTSRKTSAEEVEGGEKKLVDGVLKQVVQQTNLTGGLRRIQGGEEEITEDLKGYLAERAAAIGVDENPKDWLSRTSYGNTYEDFQAHQKKLETAKKGDV